MEGGGDKQTSLDDQRKWRGGNSQGVGRFGKGQRTAQNGKTRAVFLEQRGFTAGLKNALQSRLESQANATNIGMVSYARLISYQGN